MDLKISMAQQNAALHTQACGVLISALKHKTAMLLFSQQPYQQNEIYFMNLSSIIPDVVIAIAIGAASACI
jgi:hypothetical protein